MANSKLLLFGEYSVLYGGDSLAVPYSQFSGVLTLEDAQAEDVKTAQWSNQQLLVIAGKIQELQKANPLFEDCDLERFAFDVAHGLWFKSNIPAGSGFGSSGALVAEIMRRYGSKKLENEPLQKVHEILKTIENNFHGKSSGIDPLVAYYNRAVIIKNGQIQLDEIDENVFKDVFIFTLQLSEPRSTKYLVERFNTALKDVGLKSEFESEYIPKVNKIISSITTGKDWWHYVEELSILQLRFFKELLTDNSIKAFKEGLDSGSYFLKLMGSGGGFLMGLTRDVKVASVQLDKCTMPFGRIHKRHLFF